MFRSRGKTFFFVCVIVACSEAFRSKITYAIKDNSLPAFLLPDHHLQNQSTRKGFSRLLKAFNPLAAFSKPTYGGLRYHSSPRGIRKKLMIVAHPDDESLWGGCHLLEGDWHVVSVTNASHQGGNPKVS